MSTRPGLYIHVPFCSAICPYCDFAVTTGSPARRRRFVEALLAEIETLAPSQGFSPFDTIYLGGGTPSALAEEQIGELLEAVDRNLPTIAVPTVSIEANPEDVTDRSVEAWSALGVSRLSLGIQSFHSDELAFLGRRHTSAEARAAIAAGLAAGLTVSLDLIYGLPGQSPAAWRRNLESAVELHPDHISCYQLTIEPGTPFFKRRVAGDFSEPDNDALAELFYLTHEFLAGSGYPAYEVSNFAREPDSQCAHNRKYWEGAPYLGLGPSAHSFDGRSRWWNQRSEGSWRAALEAGATPEAEREALTDEQLALERLMLGLRTPAGVDLQALGLDVTPLLAANRDRLERFSREGLLRVEGTRWVPTLEGMARADALAREFEL